MSLADMRKELRALKKEHERPISRMKKMDISSEIERLRRVRETTPPVVAVPSHKEKAPVEKVSKVKKGEFPVVPADQPSKPAKAPAVSKGKKKDVVADKVKLNKKHLLAMLQGMDSDSE